MSLFYKQYVLRRFEPSKYEGGHSISLSKYKALHADIQTLENTSTTSESGAESKQRIKVFSRDKIQVADKKNNVRADWVHYQGKWFEAVSCRLSENTLLKHYTSEFVEVLNSELPEYVTPPTISEVQEEES